MADPRTSSSVERPGRGGGGGIAGLVAILAAAAYLVSPAFTPRLTPNVYFGGRSERQQDIVQRNTSAIGIILGELRTSMSDLLYIKTERYLDQGIAYYPHLDMKAMESEGKIVTKGKEGQTNAAGHEQDQPPADGSAPIADIQSFQGHEHEHEHDHAAGKTGEEHAHGAEYTKTVIRGAADDFRGFIGYLERHVKPWRDPHLPHHHTNGTELLPWFRLQTLSDPHNVRSYLIGSWWLKGKGETQVHEALKFVDEGLRNNPDAFQLYLMKGWILRTLGREADSLPEFEKAANKAIEIRPPGGDKGPKAEALGWDKYKEQDARTAAWMAVLIRKKTGDREGALRLARKYHKVFQDDGILERQIGILTGRIPDPADHKAPGS